MEFKNILDINLDVEVNDLVEQLDDAISDAEENFAVSFAERQYGDWVNAHGLTQSSAEEFERIQNEILRRACVVIRTRWERSGH
jgi:hypothetical protein